MVEIPDELLGNKEPFFVCSRSVLRTQVDALRALGADVFYSVKTNPHKDILKHLVSFGVGLSLSDPAQVALLETMPPDSTYYQRALTRERVRSMVAKGVKDFIVDSAAAFDNVLAEVSDIETASITVRLRQGAGFSNDYSGDYVPGLSREKALELVARCAQRGIKTGVLHHASSQVCDPDAWESKFKELHDFVSDSGVDIVNLGGGVPVDYSGSDRHLEGIDGVLKSGISELKSAGCRVICEPGRFIAAPACSLVTRVELLDDEKAVLNASLYSTHIDSILAGIKLPFRRIGVADNETIREYALLGSSLCNLDVFNHSASLPRLSAGDIIVFDNAGAYNASSEFSSGDLELFMVD